jgi:AAHS family 4-hydroxybenzoate transporter-like MFS transporter
VGAKSEERPQRVPLRELFEQGRAIQSVQLWIPYFMNLVVLYFIVSWMPLVLVGAHQTVGTGIKAVMLFSIGGVLGCVTQGPLMNRFGVRRSMLCQLLVYMLLAIVLAKSADTAPLVIGVSFVLGVAVQGVQGGLNALAAEIYPARMRATGVGCAVGIGWVGSFAGPLAGGILLQWHWTASQVFLAGIAPALVAAFAIAVKGGHPRAES